jgi:hypothetical protein
VGWHKYTYMCCLVGSWGWSCRSHIVFNTDVTNPSTTTVLTITFLVRKGMGKHAHLTVEDANCRWGENRNRGDVYL